MGRETRNRVPRHVAVIMDGNGRWAKRRAMPRHAGHRAGVKSARRTVEACGRSGVEVLTLFAFSSENWKRPPSEVGALMRLFLEGLEREVDDLHRNGVRVRFIGDRACLAAELVSRMEDAERLTAANEGLVLVIAVAYGGRRDILQATRSLADEVAAGRLEAAAISEADFASRLQLHGLPDPDLLIRTGGETRISNFLLWNLAYTECYFTPCLWPDFDEREFAAALSSFAGAERRYGLTPDQIETPGLAGA